MQVFLSYSRRDAEFVGRLARDLANRGIQTWLDTDDLAVSDEDRWRRSVVHGIRESSAMILVLSPDSVRSPAVERELTIAAEVERRIVPIVHRTCDLSDGLMFELAGVQRTDFAGQPYDVALTQLVRRVQAASTNHSGMESPPDAVEVAPPVPDVSSATVVRSAIEPEAVPRQMPVQSWPAPHVAEPEAPDGKGARWIKGLRGTVQRTELGRTCILPGSPDGWFEKARTALEEGKFQKVTATGPHELKANQDFLATYVGIIRVELAASGTDSTEIRVNITIWTDSGKIFSLKRDASEAMLQRFERHLGHSLS
jgi:TIR domain